MRDDYKRLLNAALILKKWDGPAAIAAGLTSDGYQISEQTMTNWKSRGISSIGYRKAAPIIGCRASWIETGNGEMRDLPPPVTSSSKITPLPEPIDPEIAEVLALMKATDKTGRAMALGAVKAALAGHKLAVKNQRS